MTETAIGTAKLILTGDSTGLELAIDRAKQKQLGLGAAAQAEADKMNKAQRQVIESLDRRASRVGLNREQQLLLDIQSRTTGATQDALTKKVLANAAALEKEAVSAQKTVNALNQYGLTAKQQTAALRQVPAQMTDIFVSLQGGQNPLTVLLQQGGQLRDVFGGAVPALRALLGQVAKLVTPTSLAAAAALALGVAWFKGEQEAIAYAQALALVGDRANVTISQLQGMAQQISVNSRGFTSFISEGKAAEAITAVVASGKFAADQYEAVAQAAIKMEREAGVAMDKTIDQFAALANDPTAAVAKLNGEVSFLTVETYKQIQALQEEGRTREAATIAINAYADTLNQRTDTMQENLGTLESAWRSVANVAKAAWDAMLDIGRPDSVPDQVLEISDKIKALERSMAPDASFMESMAFGHMGPKEKQAYIVKLRQQRQDIIRADSASIREDYQKAAAQEANDYAISQQQAILGHRSADEKRAAEITRSRGETDIKVAKAMAAGNTKLAEQIRANQKEYERVLNAQGKKKKGDGGLANAGASASLQEFKNAEQIQRDEIANTTKVLQAQYSARTVSTADYYTKQKQLVQQDLAIQEQSLTKQIDYLKSRDVAGKDSINTTKQIGELEAKLAKVRADGATQLVILGIQEQDVAAKRQRALDAYKESLSTANDAARKAADAQLARIILGEKEAAQQEKLAAITEDYANKQRELAREFADNNDADLYQQKLQAAREFFDEQVRIAQDSYSQMREAEADWLNGFKGGVAQWTEGARNVAEQANAITKRSLDGATDLIVNFAMTSKLQWRDLLRDIGEELVRFFAKQAVIKFIEMFASAWTGGGASAGASSMPTTGPYMAKGGVFSNSSLSQHSGTVVNRPTPFYFAKGAGVMGEAGPEGIFPLQRGSDGKLGVKAIAGGGAGSPVYITTHVNVDSNGNAQTNTQTAGEQAAMYRELAAQMSIVAQREITRAMMPGGSIWKARGGR